ncbi:MAG: rod shape-determining protein MreC [Acidobacteriota bacterium]|nr:MAG: rod shape-determining protein MreC [Acidobacteriota bacterium]
MWISVKAKDKAKKNPAWLLGILLIAHLIAISLNRAPNNPDMWFIQEIFISITTPGQSLITVAVNWVKGGVNHYFSLKDSRVENERLREQLKTDRIRILSLEEQLRDLEQSRKLSDWKSAYSYEGIEARVVGRDVNELFNTIVIDKGSASGISKNQPVVSGGGVVGRVIFVAPFASRVLLITDERHASGAVLVQTEGDRLLGLLKGTRKHHLDLQFIDPSGKVRNGEEVITSGQDGIYPAGLLLGRIRVTNPDGSVAPQVVEVEPTAPLDRLEKVSVLNIPPEKIRNVNRELTSEEQNQERASEADRRQNRR